MKRELSPWGKQCKVQMVLLNKKMDEQVPTFFTERAYHRGPGRLRMTEGLPGCFSRWEESGFFRKESCNR